MSIQHTGRLILADTVVYLAVVLCYLVAVLWGI